MQLRHEPILFPLRRKIYLPIRQQIRIRWVSPTSTPTSAWIQRIDGIHLLRDLNQGKISFGHKDAYLMVPIPPISLAVHLPSLWLKLCPLMLHQAAEAHMHMACTVFSIWMTSSAFRLAA